MNDTGLEGKKVAFVYMPWGSVGRPSMATGILKECAKRIGYTADVHYFNIRFAKLIGVELYERMSTRSTVHPDWFFSNRLFGPDGLGLMANSWQDLQSSESGHLIADKIVEVADGSVDICFDILDAIPAFIDSCINEVDWDQYKAVGFSVTFAQTLSSLLLAKRLKETYPHLVILFGGANVDSESGFEILRAFDWLDYVVHGEAEQTLDQLLNIIMQDQPFEHVPGVSARFGGKIVAGFSDAQPLADLNQSPVPDYSDYFREVEKWGLEKTIRTSLSIESSRGCWWGAKHHCTFCGLNGTTMKFRKKSADRVFDEIINLSKRYRSLAFTAVDNIIDMGYFRELLPRLANEDIDISLFYEVKANLSRDQIRLLADAGIKSVQPGIESFNTDLLRLMRKGVTTIQNIQFLKWCNEFGVDPLWNILYGFPGETREHYANYPELLRLLFHLKPPEGIFPVIFERFSPYHFEPDKFKLRINPIAEYRILYPESIVDLNKIAYYFEGQWEGEDGSPEEYLQLTKDVYYEWVTNWQEGKTIFQYEKGPGFLTIFDNRPWRGGGDSVMRRLTLNELQSKVYLFCDENRSFSAIRRMLLESYPSPPSEEQIQKLLDQFVSRGLMFREQDRYLSLAVRKKTRSKQRRQVEISDQTGESLSRDEHTESSQIPALYQLQNGIQANLKNS